LGLRVEGLNLTAVSPYPLESRTESGPPPHLLFPPEGEGHRGGGREGGREGGRDRGREGSRDGGMEGWREGGVEV